MNRFNKNNLIRGLSYFKRNGVKESIYKAYERLVRDNDEADYDALMRNAQASEAEKEAQRAHVFEEQYKISVLIPVYETDENYLFQTLESVAQQTYSNWELCIADASKDDRRRNVIKNFCEEYSLKCSDSFGDIYSKVNYKFLEKNEGISGNTNRALEMATGDYIALLDHDDLLEPTALYDFMTEVCKRVPKLDEKERKSCRVLVCYTDEDKISSDRGRYFDHHIKPDFDPVLLCTNNYICHFLIVDTAVARGVGGFRSDYDGAQDHDFILRCTEGISRNQIVHIPKVLYHWRSTDSSTAENPNAKLYAYESGKRAVEDYYKRAGIKTKVSDTAHRGFYRMDYDEKPDGVCVLSAEKYRSLNEAEIKNIPEDYIMILADDLKPVHKDYVAGMMKCMNLGYVGAVTGKIIDKKGRVESAGFDIGDAGEAVPRFKGLRRNFSGYLHRASIQQIVEGFSKDCVLIRKCAVKNYYPEIVLLSDYDIYYEPNEEFERSI